MRAPVDDDRRFRHMTSKKRKYPSQPHFGAHPYHKDGYYPHAWFTPNTRYSDRALKPPYGQRYFNKADTLSISKLRNIPVNHAPQAQNE